MPEAVGNSVSRRRRTTLRTVLAAFGVLALPWMGLACGARTGAFLPTTQGGGSSDDGGQDLDGGGAGDATPPDYPDACPALCPREPPPEFGSCSVFADCSYLPSGRRLSCNYIGLVSQQPSSWSLSGSDVTTCVDWAKEVCSPSTVCYGYECIEEAGKTCCTCDGDKPYEPACRPC